MIASKLRIETVWLLLPLVLVFATTAASPLKGDAWWTITTGRLIAATHTLPTSYPFTFPPQSTPFVDAQWLAQLVYVAPYPLLGLEGIVVLDAMLVTATFALLLALAFRRSRSARAAALCTALGGVVAGTNLQPRAQTLGYLCFAATLWLLGPPALGGRTDAPHDRWRIGALFAIEALWANLHGSFFLGLALTALFFLGHVGEQWRSQKLQAVLSQSRTRFLLFAGLAQALATLITPFSLGLYAYVLQLSGNATIRTEITEWLPPRLDTSTGVVFFVSLGLVVACLAGSRLRWRLTDVLLLTAFGVLGLQAIRNVAWWGLILGPVLAPYAAQVRLPLRSGDTPSKPIRVLPNAILIGALGLIALSALPWVKDANPLLPDERRGVITTDAPRDAARFLATRTDCGRVFSPQTWSGYLEWSFWPRCLTMVDEGPIEVYSQQVWDDYWTMHTGDQAAVEILDKYGVDLLVLSEEQQARLIEQVRASPRWRQIYGDEQAGVFERTE
jgi:hypothetical protein